MMVLCRGCGERVDPIRHNRCPGHQSEEQKARRRVAAAKAGKPVSKVRGRMKAASEPPARSQPKVSSHPKGRSEPLSRSQPHSNSAPSALSHPNSVSAPQQTSQPKRRSAPLNIRHPANPSAPKSPSHPVLLSDLTPSQRLDRIRAQGRERVRRFRAKQKEEAE